MPGDCHPAYADKPFIRDWLNGPNKPRDYILVPILRSAFASYDVPTEPIALSPRTMMLMRKRCAGPAPYVGDPFCYEWEVAVDDLGRVVAGDARIQYLSPF
jgi:hypothetical protein